MKSIFKTLVLTLASAALLAGSVSCEKHDYPDRFRATEGLPTIHYVKQADADVFVTQAYMSDVLCIVGENLKSVHNLFFNDQEAILNTSFITDNTLIVTVPSTQAVDKTDKIYFYNKDGESTTYDFKVLPPAPKVSTMSNEWAAAGQKAYITGKYFMDVESISFNGTELKNYTVTSTDRIDFTVPEGLSAGPITVTTASGSATSAFWYKDNRGMMFDFDTPNSVTGIVLDKNGWNSHNCTTDDTALSGNFFQLGDGSMTITGDNSTWNEDMGFVYWPGDTWGDIEYFESHPKLDDVADFSGWSSKALKFEIYVPASSPWKGGNMQICFAGIDKVTGAGAAVDVNGNTCAGANNSYFSGEDNPRAIYSPWASSGSFDTGNEWLTVTIPLTDFIYTYSGEVCANSLKDTSFSSLWIFVVGGKTQGSDCTPIIKIDNIRVVNNQ